MADRTGWAVRLNGWQGAAELRQSHQRVQLRPPGATPNPLAITVQELPLSRHDLHGRNAQEGSKEWKVTERLSNSAIQRRNRNGDQKEGKLKDTHHCFVRVWKLNKFDSWRWSGDVESWRGPHYHSIQQKEGHNALPNCQCAGENMRWKWWNCSLSNEAKGKFRVLRVAFLEGVFLGEGLSHQALWGRAAVDRDEARQGG